MSRERRGAEAEEREMEVEGAEEEEVEETGQGRKTKPGRNVRFSHDENCVLVHHIVPCYEVILGNLAARTPLRRHHQLWARVCDAVNVVGPLKRSVAHCRKRFSDVKRRLKEKMAEKRRSTRRTGGGPPLRMEYTSHKEELRQIMPAEIVEAINVQDTDSPSFGQVVESHAQELTPSPRSTPPPSLRDSASDEQAGPSSYQAPLRQSLAMSPEPEEEALITLETVDAPVSGLHDVSPGPAEPLSHQQPAPPTMDPAREMVLSVGLFQQQQTTFMQSQTRHMSQIAAQLRRIHRTNSQIPAAINRLANAMEQSNVQMAQMTGAVEALHSTIREGNANVTQLAGQIQQELIARLPHLLLLPPPVPLVRLADQPRVLLQEEVLAPGVADGEERVASEVVMCLRKGGASVFFFFFTSNVFSCMCMHSKLTFIVLNCNKCCLISMLSVFLFIKLNKSILVWGKMH
ncbi:uncharacterized protein LOC142098054 [Mixophyes fleayi]|uniref:uncharacterized protein LOC142098054 n=1 Tax=Mixophyes fleayi TaxID=3061075 RepID=UPI003F4D792F